jgi:class 3 adenylate cyclase
MNYRGIPVTTVARTLVDLTDDLTAEELTNVIHEAAYRRRFSLTATKQTMKRAAAEFGGTIKDLAGDGALILIGAPVPFRDEPARALGLARGLQARARATVRGYSRRLGLGVGVATGEVAVGIVGQGARYEYVAVGPAVNLAARLCDEAADGEIRVDADTLAGAGEALPSKAELRPLKGMGREVETYVVSPAPSGGD